MDEAYIQQLKNKLNVIIDVLNSQIQECDKKIEYNNRIIAIQKENLANNANLVVIVETNLKEFQKIIGDYMAQRVGFITSKVILINEIAQLNQEIESIKKEIEQRTSPGAIAWDAFNHIFNPFGAAVSDIIRALYDNLNEKVRKVQENQKVVDEKHSKIDDLDKQISQNEQGAKQLNIQYDKLKNEGAHIDEIIKENGRLKTIAENLKVQFQSFINHANTLLSKCNDSKDMLEFGIDEVSSLEKEVKDLFTQNGLTITF